MEENELNGRKEHFYRPSNRTGNSIKRLNLIIRDILNVINVYDGIIRTGFKIGLDFMQLTPIRMCLVEGYRSSHVVSEIG